jgi:O-methyltransferase
MTHSIVSYLTAPQVRYKYLPRLQEVMSYNRKEQILYTCLEYAYQAEVKGDYLEFGMWKGGSMIAAYHLSQRFPGLSDMRFYGFDSFEGIPSLTTNKSEADYFPPGMFEAGLEEVKRNLVNAKLDMKRVTLIGGWFAETLNQKTKATLPLKHAAVVNVDCDVYESTVSVLDFIESYLADGSIIIFDDWYCFRNRDELGEQKAFREWLARNRYLKATPYKEFGWDGKAFIINLLSPTPESKVSGATKDHPQVGFTAGQALKEQ